MPKAPRQSLLFDRFRWYLSLARPCRRIWEELQKQGVITSDSIVQLPKHLPKNRSLGVLEYNFPKAAIVFEVYFGAVAAGRFLCEPVGEVKVGWWKMTVGRFSRQRYKGQPELRSVPDLCRGQRFHNRTLVRACNRRAFFFQGEERPSARRPADFEFLRQVDLR